MGASSLLSSRFTRSVYLRNSERKLHKHRVSYQVVRQSVIDKKRLVASVVSRACEERALK